MCIVVRDQASYLSRSALSSTALLPSTNQKAGSLKNELIFYVQQNGVAILSG